MRKKYTASKTFFLQCFLANDYLQHLIDPCTIKTKKRPIKFKMLFTHLAVLYMSIMFHIFIYLYK